MTVILTATLAGAALAGLPGCMLALAGAVLSRVARRRGEPARLGRALQTQLPEALRTMSAVLRAGQALPQAVDAARDASPEPLRSVLARASERRGIGASFEQWTGEIVGALPPRPARLAGLAFAVGRAGGAGLPRALEAVASSVAERERVETERAVATAQARLSAWIVASMPLVFLLVVGVRSDTARVLVGTPTGRIMLAAGVALEVAGIAWSRRIVRGPG